MTGYDFCTYSPDDNILELGNKKYSLAIGQDGYMLHVGRLLAEFKQDKIDLQTAFDQILFNLYYTILDKELDVIQEYKRFENYSEKEEVNYDN